MQTILPGKPQARLQAVSTAKWNGQRLVVYISGNAVVVLGGPHELVQTIYLDQCEELSAVILDGKTGDIAASSDEEVYIYKPYGGDEGALRWTLSNSLELPHNDAKAACLSWGSDQELLVGTASLSLHQTTASGEEIWNQDLPKPVKYASFSPDANLVASCGWYDRNVKIWRRQSFDPDDTRFDFTYLAHPWVVTTIQWRQPPEHEHHHYEQVVDDVLYTVCADSKIRIWAASDPHGTTYLQLWAQLDMQECLQPRNLQMKDQDLERLVFFISQDNFRKASTNLFDGDHGQSEEEDHVQDHLAEIAKTKPDICVILDRCGNMSAWGLENVGCKVRKESDIFNVAHVQDFDLQLALAHVGQRNLNVALQCFLVNDLSTSLSLIIHHFDGRISWHEACVSKIFDPSGSSDRAQLKTQWTGHQSPILMLHRDRTGQALLSHSDDGDSLVWKQEHHAAERLLQRRSDISGQVKIIDSHFLGEGKLLLTLSQLEVTLWDVQAPAAIAIARGPLDSPQGSFLLALPDLSRGDITYNVAIVNSDRKISVWSCLLPKGQRDQPQTDENQTGQLRYAYSCSLDSEVNVASLRGVYSMEFASANSVPTHTSGAKPWIIGHSSKGTVHLWTARLSQAQQPVSFATSAVFETGICEASLVSGSQTGKVGVVDILKTSLTIWDSKTSLLEYEHSFEPSDTIQKLDWTYTVSSLCALAVVSSNKINIIGQMRYNWTTSTTSWATLWEVNIKNFTSHPVGDSLWLSHGSLVVGAGNQIFVCSEDLSKSGEKLADLDLPGDFKATNLLDIVSDLNAALPLYHPQFLHQISLAGHIEFVGDIIITLYEALKYYVPGDSLNSHLLIPLRSVFTLSAAPLQPADTTRQQSNVEEHKEFNEADALAVNESLSKIELPYMTRNEQLLLIESIECLAATHKLRRAMDDNGKRYYLSFRQRKIRERHQLPEMETPQIPWKEIVWAMQSDSQDILVDHVVRQYQGRLAWRQAVDCGISLWMSDQKALESQFEAIARNEYTKTDEKNPIDCSLYYLALRKKTVLLGLWRMATWNREQQGTSKLLKNDFSQSRWKTAALKNAYALLGKRRFEYAAAWFLLADHLQDAVNVCVNQMGDLQLAIAIARVYGGNESAVLRSLVKQQVLPQAASEGNRWQATWAFTILGQHDMAIRALIEPLHQLIPLSHSPLLKARSYLSHEPALIHLYRHLRAKFLQKPNARFPISSKGEWDYVIQTARTYDRMGCGLLALDLVRNWQFVQPAKIVPVPAEDPTKDEKKSRRRKSSAAVVKSPKSPVKEKTKPTTFQEPDSSSLLDNFGF